MKTQKSVDPSHAALWKWLDEVRQTSVALNRAVDEYEQALKDEREVTKLKGGLKK